MEENVMNPLVATHLLQHTLRSFCIHQNSQWIYAVFWRILPRNFPPPKWDSQVELHDRSRGNKRNWILAWEDGFCNFTASPVVINSDESAPPSVYINNVDGHPQLKPEVFFKMSHEIHKFGEGMVGKVAADHSHKWIYKDKINQEKNSSAWYNLLDSHPRTWEAQFQSGLETIALIALKEGVLQLGAVEKINEDLSYVVLVRKKLSYIENIPGFLLPHPASSSTSNFKIHDNNNNIDDANQSIPERNIDDFQNTNSFFTNGLCHLHFPRQPAAMKLVAPSMASLEALLSKLPSVEVAPPPPHLITARPVDEDSEGDGGDGDGIGGSAPPPSLSY